MSDTDSQVVNALPKRKRGRPKKTEIEAKKPGGRGKVGRPPGDAAVMAEYKARMLASPKSIAVLDKVFAVALDDDHKHQAVCLKMVVDRLAPVSSFELEKNTKGLSGIRISINSAGGEVAVDGEVIEHE